MKNLIKKWLNNRFPIAYGIFYNFKSANYEFCSKHRFGTALFLLKLILNKQDANYLKTLKPRGFLCSEYLFESDENNKIIKDCNEIESVCKKYSLISFDVFDTAIVRNVAKPSTIFDMVGIELGCPNFSELRVYCEKIARENKLKVNKTDEVTIFEIYEVLNDLYSIPKNGAFKEIDLEIKFSRGNSFIYELYKKMIENNKSIMFITDMYLPKEIIKKILFLNGYKKYDKLIVSNVEGFSKSSGKLWKYNKYLKANKNKIFHIGDNFYSDYKNPLSFGYNAYYLKANKERFTKYENDKLSNNIAWSMAKGLICNRFKRTNYSVNIYKEHGYAVGGILCYSFVKTINLYAKNNKFDLVVFCARDCEIIYKIYKKLFNSTPSVYLKVSRFALTNLSLERYFDDLMKVFNDSVSQNEGISLKQLLIRADLEFICDEIIDNHFININKKISENDLPILKKYLMRNINKIIKSRSTHIAAAREYYKQYICDKTNILVVDIGWNGSSYYQLKYFLEKRCGYSGKMQGYLLFGNDNPLVNNLEITNSIKCFVGSPNNNTDLLSSIYDYYKYNFIDGRQLIEYIFNSIDDSLLKYKFLGDKIEFIYAANKHKKFSNIIDMQQGIEDFCRDYNESIHLLNFDIDINPYVAFFPMNCCLKNIKYLKQVYSNYIYNDMTGNFKNCNLITFGEVFKNK